MLRILPALCLILVISTAFGSPAQAASFDCDRAVTKTEIAICSLPELSALDDMMAIIWTEYLANLYEIHPVAAGAITDDPLKSPQIAMEEQREWISEADVCAGNGSCLEESYKRRIRSISKSTFTGYGGNTSDHRRLYFKPLSERGCQRESDLSVDQYFDEDRQLCFELVPNSRWFRFFAAGGVMLVEYYELAAGYFDCYRYDLLQMELRDASASTRERWVAKYTYRDFNAESDGRRELNGREVGLVINLKDGLQFEEYHIGCGMKNVGLSVERGLGGIHCGL